MPILETRYEKGGDVTYVAGSALLGGRLVRLNAAGVSKSKPSVVYTSAATELAVGAVFQDAANGEDVGVSHRSGSWQKLEAHAAITFGSKVVPAASGRVAAGAAPATDQVYGVALQAAAAQGDLIWVKVL